MTESTAAFWTSPQQKLIWSQDGAVWNAVALIPLEGMVREDGMRRALEQLVARHEILRTVFRARPGMKVPFQVVLDSAPPSWEVKSGDPDETFREAQGRKFDLEQGPLVHGTLVYEESGAALILSVPALLSDGNSLAVLARELEDLYAGRELEPAALSYVQFAQWQGDLLESNDENAQSAKEFWSERTATALGLPEGDKFQPESVSVAGEFGAEADVLLAAWQSLLWRLTGQAQFETGVWFGGREYAELKNAPGVIGKFLPMAARFDGNFRFSEIVSNVRTARDGAAEWQEYFTPGVEGSIAFEYWESPLRQEACTERFALKLSAGPKRLDFHYDASRLSRNTVERWAGHYRVLLTAVLADPETPVASLPLLSDDERQQFALWNQTVANYPRDRCLHELFEEQAVLTPDLPAVRCGDTALSYRELNQRANQLAHHLRGFGVRPDSLVALCVERSVDMIAALLGILKAGGAFVPLNADNPKPRLAEQLAGAVALVTESKLAPSLPDFSGPTLLVDHSDSQSQNPENPEPLAKPDNLMYVIYTSGSTGVPKPVGIRHRNLVNYAWFVKNRLPGEHLHFATVSTLSADLGNTCIYPALLSGGCLHVIPHDVASDAARFAAYQKKHPIDALKIVPSHLSALLETEEGRGVLPRRHLITGGESLTWPLVHRIGQLGATCEIWNHYGPTETTVGSLMLRLQDFSGPVIPIGRPIANTQVHILDSLRQPVPVGVTGELYIAGDGVTAGYLGQPALTAERFLDGMYRTGDLARFLPDGNLEFLGRADDQVKIRGFRIELGEIEAVLARHPSVRQTVVIARADERGDKRLIGYVVSPHELEADQLRDYLKEQLPDYMVPSHLVTLAKLPLTANGKIDRQKLPEPEEAQARVYIAPRTETEQAVAAIWCEVFHRQQIGVDARFFEIGGHSLLATQVISRVRERFRVQLDMRILFEQPTIEGLSQAIDTAPTESEESEIIPVSRESYRSRK